MGFTALLEPQVTYVDRVDWLKSDLSQGAGNHCLKNWFRFCSVVLCVSSEKLLIIKIFAVILSQ